MSSVSLQTKSLMHEVEQNYARNQYLKQQLELAEQARIQAEEEAKSYKSESNTILTSIQQELQQLRQDTILAEEEILQHKQRATEALELSRQKLQNEETIALQREQEIKERIQNSRNDLLAVQNKVNILKTDIEAIQSYDNEILALKNRLGKYALPLHKELVQIHKDTKVSTEAAIAEINRLKEQKERLLNEVNTLAKEKESLTQQLHISIQSQQTIQSLNDEYTKENVNLSVLLQTEMAKAVRQGADMDTLFFASSDTSNENESNTAAGSSNQWKISDTINLIENVASVSLRNSRESSPITKPSHNIPSSSILDTDIPENAQELKNFVKLAMLEVENSASQLGFNLSSI